MVTISISNQMLKDEDIVIVPRKEYERLLHVAEDKTLTLDESLDTSLKEAQAGKVFGPYKSARALMKSLRTKR